MPMRVVTFKAEEEFIEKMDGFAKLLGIPRSELIRRAVEEYMKRKWNEVGPKPKIIKLYT